MSVLGTAKRRVANFMAERPDTVSSRNVKVTNKLGLHARAAAKFVRLAQSFDAEVTVMKNGMSVSGSSILGLMMLAAAPGSELELRATGPAAEAALTALCALVTNKFEERV